MKIPLYCTYVVMGIRQCLFAHPNDYNTQVLSCSFYMNDQLAGVLTPFLLLVYKLSVLCLQLLADFDPLGGGEALGSAGTY